jgi:DNA-directed RNA polymerase subunit K/omega
MSKRVELLNRVDGSALSPFLLCNLLARRARQLADGRHVVLSPELVDETLREFLEGKLKYEFEGRRRHPAPSSMVTATADHETHPGNGATPGQGGRRSRSVQEDPDSSFAGLRRR